MNSNTKAPRAAPNSAVSKVETKKRMTIQLPKDTAEFLEWLAQEQDISQVEAIRKAIATEYYFQKEIKQGAKVLVQNQDQIKEIIFR